MRDFASLFFRLDEGLVMILAVYADDSTDPERKRFFTVGGFMGWPERFFEAERKWQQSLKKNNLEYFKASEVDRPDGQFHPSRLMMEPRASRTFGFKGSRRRSKCGCAGSGVACIDELASR